MSARLGQLQLDVFTAATLAVAGGRTFALNNGANAFIAALAATYVASATVGNRVPVIRILNAGNLLWQSVQGTNVTASQTALLMAGGGVQGASVATPITQYFPLPVELTVPPFSQVQIFDNADVDHNPTTGDTVSLNASIVM